MSARCEGQGRAVTVREFARRVFRAQWPILLVGVFFLAAFVLVVAGYWRRGALVIGIGVGVAAALRLALHRRPGRPAGGAQQGHRLRHHGDGQRVRHLHRLDDRPAGHQLAEFFGAEIDVCGPLLALVLQNVDFAAQTSVARILTVT